MTNNLLIDFSRINESVSAAIETAFKNDPNLKRASDDLIDSFCNNFDELTNTVFEEPKDDFKSVMDFLHNNLNENDAENIAIIWPPKIPNSFIPGFDLIIRILQKVNDKPLFLQWVSAFAYQKIWPTKNSIYSSVLKAISFCKKDDTLNWVTLDSDDVFTLYKVKKNKVSCTKRGKLNQVSVEWPNVSIQYEPFKIELSLSGSSDTGNKAELSPKKASNEMQKNREIVFIPVNQKHIKLWSVVREEKQKFISYMATGGIPYPMQFVIAVYHLLTMPDGLLIKSLIKSCRFNIEISKAIWSIFRYSERISTLIETIIVSEMNDVANFSKNSLFSNDSVFTTLYKMITKQSCQYYYTNYLVPLITYIDSEDLKANKPQKCDKKKLEKVFFNSLKYLLSTVDNIPDEIKFIASIIKNVSAIRFNNRKTTLKFLGHFIYTKVIKNCLLHNICDDDEKDYEFKFKSSSETLINLLGIAFHFETMTKQKTAFRLLDSRLKYHYSLRLEEFLINASEVRNIPEFGPVPETSQLEKNMSIVIDCIAENNEKMRELLKHYTDQTSSAMTNVGVNIAAGVCQAFQWTSDRENIRLRQRFLHDEHVNSPKISITNSTNPNDDIESTSPIRADLPPAPPLTPDVFANPAIQDNDSSFDANDFTNDQTQGTIDPGPSSPFIPKTPKQTPRSRKNVKAAILAATDNDFLTVAKETKNTKKVTMDGLAPPSDIVPERKTKSKRRKSVKTVEIPH